MLAERDWWFKRDQYGRVHTNYTNLWSPLRQFLSLDDEPLVEMDIANSQPLFFGLFSLGKYRKGQMAGCDRSAGRWNSFQYESTRTDDNINRVKGHSSSSSLYDASASVDDQRRSLPSDLDKYLALVEQGAFYQFLMDKTRWAGACRADFKVSFFKHVFYANRSYPNPYAKVFMEEFPTAYAVLADLKTGEPRDAPRKMQRLEADFVIDTCCCKLLVSHPDVPILTLHDGVWTTPSYIGLVRRTFEDEFAKLGVRPLLRCRAANGATLAPAVSVQT